MDAWQKTRWCGWDRNGGQPTYCLACAHDRQTPLCSLWTPLCSTRRERKSYFSGRLWVSGHPIITRELIFRIILSQFQFSLVHHHNNSYVHSKILFSEWRVLHLTTWWRAFVLYPVLHVRFTVFLCLCSDQNTWIRIFIDLLPAMVPVFSI